VPNIKEISELYIDVLKEDEITPKMFKNYTEM